VLGKIESLEEDRTASPDVYTRPEVLVWKKKKYKVPPVLLSGDHKKIEEWKTEQLARNDKKSSKSVVSAQSANKGSPRPTQRIIEEWKTQQLARNNKKADTTQL
jgi:tRNA (guanine-N1)-methyltransferase